MPPSFSPPRPDVLTPCRVSLECVVMHVYESVLFLSMSFGDIGETEKVELSRTQEFNRRIRCRSRIGSKRESARGNLRHSIGHHPKASGGENSDDWTTARSGRKT